MPGSRYQLPDELLPTVALTQAEADKYRSIANEVVQRTLEQEIDLRCHRQGQLDERKWRFVKGRDRVKIYKRLTPKAAGAAPLLGENNSARDTKVVPMVVAYGSLNCNLMDAIYGVHHKTTEEMRITTAFCNKRHIDSAILHTIDTGTDEDPFHYLGIKWRLTESPGGTIIRNRDALVLEYEGTGVDAQGERYAFHMIKSIEARWFPPLKDPRIVRARLMLCCIYRQIEPGIVNMYIKGVFRMGGDLPEFLAYQKAADTLLAIPRTVECAEAKRLTLYIMLTKRALQDAFRLSQRLPAKDMSIVERDAASISSYGDWESDDDHVRSNTCALCLKPRPLLKMIGSAWHRCRICEQTMCGKCSVKKTVIAYPRHLIVPVCTACIMESKMIPVDPRDPYPILNGINAHVLGVKPSRKSTHTSMSSIEDSYS